MKSTKNASKTRNGPIDVVKFISCLFIVMYHFNIYTETRQYFRGGKFGVEIFCIIAGVFFFQKYLKQKENISVFSYAKSRFLRFFPYTTASFFLLYTYLSLTGRGRSIVQLIDQGAIYIWEILLVGMCGLNRGALLNFPTWTISCLLIVECSVLGLLICCRKLFFNFILPVSLVVIYGIWFNMESVNYRTWLGFVNFGVLQVWCAVIWGILAVLTAEILSKIKHTSKALTGVELFCYLSAIMIMLTRADRYWCYVLTLFAFVGISITISQKSYSCVIIKDSKFTRWLGSMSLAVYLNHSLVLKFFQRELGPEKMFATWPMFLVVLLVIAIIYNAILEKMLGYSRKISVALKQHYLENEV